MEEAEHDHGHIHQDSTNEEKDPHVWVDPVSAQHQVRMICEALSTADPANRLYYEENAAQYISKLEAVDTEYREATAKARHKSFITSHAAFNYLAKRYNLQQIPISGMAPNAEPSPERLKVLIEETKERQLKYVFFETLVNPKVAEIVAKEAGVKTLVLNPLEGLTEVDVAAGKDYLILMRENLTNLKLALEVQ
jgi:zinc transport system substrate-binding protein